MRWSELGLDGGDGGDRATGVGAGRVGAVVLTGAPAQVPDPATEGVVADIAWATAADVDAAVGAAVAAQTEWSASDVRDRARALRSIAEDLRAVAEPLGELISAESGKRLSEAVAEVGFSARYFDWFADASTRVSSTYYRTEQRHFVVEHRPVGVVAAISPWNFPLSIPARKLAAALAAGCAVVQKPSELAPLSAVALTALCERHLPPGAVGVLVGEGRVLTPALVDHPDVRAVSFTGSTAVGRSVAERAARGFTRAVLELGGRAPFVVCEDADVDVAVEALVVAKLRNNGESCLAANNVFVHEDRYGEVLAALRERLAGLVVGDPRDPATDLGPLIRPEAVDRVRGLADAARAGGDAVETFGTPPASGWFAPAALVESRSARAGVVRGAVRPRAQPPPVRRRGGGGRAGAAVAHRPRRLRRQPRHRAPVRAGAGSRRGDRRDQQRGAQHPRGPLRRTWRVGPRHRGRDERAARVHRRADPVVRSVTVPPVRWWNSPTSPCRTTGASGSWSSPARRKRPGGMP